MPEMSASIVERSRQNESAILRALASVTQTRIAEMIGVHESTVSKMVTDGSVEKTARFLAAAGLQLVPAGSRLYEPEYIKSLQVLAARHLTNETGSTAHEH